MSAFTSNVGAPGASETPLSTKRAPIAVEPSTTVVTAFVNVAVVTAESVPIGASTATAGFAWAVASADGFAQRTSAVSAASVLFDGLVSPHPTMTASTASPATAAGEMTM